MDGRAKKRNEPNQVSVGRGNGGRSLGQEIASIICEPDGNTHARVSQVVGPGLSRNRLSLFRNHANRNTRTRREP